jgi:predicted Zn-dependent protease
MFGGTARPSRLLVMLKRILSLLILVTTLVGCAANPVTGRQQFLLVSERQSISASREAYDKMLDPLAEEGKVDNDPAVAQRIHEITAKLIAQAIKYRPETRNWDWRVKVIDDPEMINAWCMAGGKMAIYTGLIEKLDATDDELAQVMGHEISHALLAHTAERMSIAIATNLAITTYAITQDADALALTGATLAAALAITLPNSRESESEADVVGIELAARAGYDPRVAVTLWKKMAKASGNDSEFDFLSTHPAPKKRMDKLNSLVPKMMPYYEAEGERPVYPLKTDPPPKKKAAPE